MDRQSGTWDPSSPASTSPKALRRGGCRRQPRRTPPCHFDACPSRSFFDRTDPTSVRRRSPSPPRRSSRSKRAPSLSVTVLPASPGLGVSFVLPAGLEPARSNLPGVTAARPLDGDVPGADARGPDVSGELRAPNSRRGRPSARASRRRDGCRVRGRRHLGGAVVAAVIAHRLDGRGLLDRGAVRPADCACAAATLDYVAVTVFGVIARAKTSRAMANLTNPFVYGEIVPVTAFVDREVELDRLGRDLYAGQKVFLISPRRYGKSSLVRQALKSAARSGALTVEVQVSSYSSYVAFLEGYARALASAETRLERARSWLSEMLTGVRPEVRIEPDETGRGQIAVSFPSVRSDRDVSHLAHQVFALPGRIAEVQAAPDGDRARRVPGNRGVQRRQRRARAPRRGPAAAASGLCLLRFRADADGEDARQEPAVLQGRPGDAPAEDPCGSVRRVHRIPVQGHRLQARGRAWRRDCRPRRQSALRRPASGARGLGRCEGWTGTDRRISRTCMAR